MVGWFKWFLPKQECAGAGPNVPATETRLDPTTATCTDSLRDVRIGHALQLAPFCDGTGFVYYNSLFVECAFGNEFYQPKVDEVYRYSCAETVLFDIGATETKDLPTAIIRTDQSWQVDLSPSCVRVTKPGDGDNAAPLAPRVAPTIMPVVGVGALQPAILGGSAPQSGSASRGDSNTDQSSKAPIGIIVGVPVGVVLFLAIAGAVLFVLLCWKPRQHNQKDTPVKEVSEHAAYDPTQTGDSGQDDHHHFGEEDVWMGHHIPAPGATPAAAPYRAAAAAARPMEVMDDHYLSEQRVAAAQSLGQSPSEDSPDQRYSYSDQSEVAAVTFKDQAQSMIVEGQPMMMMMPSSNIHSSPQAARTPSSAAAGSNNYHGDDFPGRPGGERNNYNAVSSPDRRRFAYQQQDDSIVVPVTLQDNYAQSVLIRPETIGVPTHATDQEEAQDSLTYTSGLTEADNDTRGSSDPSGVYVHEMSLLDPHYNGSSSPRDDHHRGGAGAGPVGSDFDP
jgi:hypothetical protein